MVAREALETWDIDEILSALVAAFDSALKGKAAEVTQASETRTEKLRAILALVR